MKHHEEQCFTLWSTALELSQHMHKLYISTKYLASYWTFSLPTGRITNHLNTFLIANFSYKLSIVRLSLVKASCSMVIIATHQMILLDVMVTAIEMEVCTSLPPCIDITQNEVESIYNPLFLHVQKTSFSSYIPHVVLQTVDGHCTTYNEESFVKYMYLILHRRNQHQNNC